MPLVRYEVRSEHSLANPELFRSAARDDPEGLLEGVAMAGLVGIVRQLGDLAEFAAEVFRDLHKELTSVGGRAHDLTVRVQQLEAELPAVEKALLSEPNQLRFAYTNGADWHASIRSDQNHCTSGELPRFVRNFYEECRGPPRLFLLDKFDEAGAGACLKRYSDPSFFKLEWARSELMKAQRAQRDKKARREKKKGRRRKTGQPIAAINQIPARVRYGSATLEDLDSLSHLLAPTLKNEVGSSSSNRGSNQGNAAQTQRRSNLGSQNKGVGSPLPPSGAPASQAEGRASKSIKISAKDIESNVSVKFYQPNETENAAGSMAGKISKIIEMEDREAVPPVGLIPRNVGNRSPKSVGELKRSDPEVGAKGTKRPSREELEAATMGHSENISRGTSRGNGSMDGREGSNSGNRRVPQSSMPDVSSKENASLASKEELNTGDSRIISARVPDDRGLPVSEADSSRTSSLDVGNIVQLSGNVSQRSVDAQEAHVIAAGFSGQNSESSRGVGSNLSNAPTISTFEDTSGVKGLAEQFIPAGHQSLPNHSNLENISDASHGVGEQLKHSIAEAPAGDVATPSTAVKSEELVFSASGVEPAFHDVHPPEVQRRANNVVDTNEVSIFLEERVYKPTHLPPVRIEGIVANEEESHMISATSPKISSQWSSPGEDDLRPSISMLSRLSYSSELMPVSSGSEPESPVSPNSPDFNVLYSPPGSPSRNSGFMNESPLVSVGSYSRTARHPGYSSPRSEIPLLSLSHRSRLASPTPAPWADQGDHAGPSRPPPPLPEDSSHLESREDVSSVESQLYPLPSTLELDLPTSSEVNGLPSQSIDELASPQENAEKLHAEPISRSSGNPNPLHIGDHFEAPSVHVEPMQPSVTYLEVEVRPPSTTLAASVSEPSRSSSTSPFDLTGPATIQPSSKSFDSLDPQHGTESLSVDVPSNGPTSRIDLLSTPVGELEAYPFSVSREDPTPNSAATGVSVHPTQSPLRQAINIAPPSFPTRDEESVPSSPTGSVIIKDTPSPPASPASNYSESESELNEYYPSLDQPRTSMSPRPITHALDDVINHGETSGGDIGLHQDPRFKSSEIGPTTTVSDQATQLTNSASENLDQAAYGLPEDRAEALASDTSTHLDISDEETLLQVNPLTSSHLDSGPTGPLHRSEAAVLRPISMTTSAPKSLNNSASNSPPDTPLGEEFIAGEDEASTLQWTRTSRPDSPFRTEIRVPSASSGRSASNSPPTSPPKFLDNNSSLKRRGRSDPASSDRSASNSPPTSPPKFLDHASSLKWRGRSDPASLKPDFSLPPNLVCRSETSSPPCSPPPPSDLESLKEWDVESEISNISESSEPAHRTREEAADVEVYRLPDSPLPPDSPTISDEGDHLPGPSSRLVSDEEDDIAPDHEHEMAETTTAISAFQHLPDSFSDKSSFEVLSSAPEDSYNSHQPSDAQLRLSTFEPPTESVFPDSFLQVDISQESAFQSQRNPNPIIEAHKPPTLPSVPGATDIPTTDAVAAAIAHHDWNMMKALSVQDPGRRPLPPPEERNILLEQIRTKSFNLRRTDSMEKKDPIIRPAANINVAAILEKANAIRQAFIGSDGEGDDEDDWSDS